jgi:hypothetical protein
MVHNRTLCNSHRRIFVEFIFWKTRIRLQHFIFQTIHGKEKDHSFEYTFSLSMVFLESFGTNSSVSRMFCQKSCPDPLVWFISLFSFYSEEYRAQLMFIKEASCIGLPAELKKNLLYVTVETLRLSIIPSSFR